MGISREVKTTLEEVLDMVNCAEDYGHGNQMFMGFAAEIAGEVTDEEIEEYAQTVASQEGYGQEDYEEAKKRLNRWRSQYVHWKGEDNGV